MWQNKLRLASLQLFFTIGIQYHQFIEENLALINSRSYIQQELIETVPSTTNSLENHSHCQENSIIILELVYIGFLNVHQPGNFEYSEMVMVNGLFWNGNRKIEMDKNWDQRLADKNQPFLNLIFRNTTISMVVCITFAQNKVLKR